MPLMKTQSYELYEFNDDWWDPAFANHSQTMSRSRTRQTTFARVWNITWMALCIIEGSLEVKLPTIWRDEKQSREEAERRERLEERRVEEKE